MSDPRRLEGWGVRAKPAALAMAGLLALLVAAVTAGGFWYDARYRPRTHPRLGLFPEPRLETMQRAPREAMGAGPARPRDIAAAERAVIADGDALWGTPRPPADGAR